jgi:hydrogenase expression/formation protein HypC
MREIDCMCLGIPGRIISIIDPAEALAMVDVAGVRRPVNVSFVLDDRPAEACVGEWVLVHVGFAMSRIDAAEAARTLALLEELGEMQAEVRAMQPEAPISGV